MAAPGSAHAITSCSRHSTRNAHCTRASAVIVSTRNALVSPATCGVCLISSANIGGFRGSGGAGRQGDREQRALFRRGLDADRTAHPGDDLVRDREAEPAALAGGTGAEEWLEDLRQDVVRDAVAV